MKQDICCNSTFIKKLRKSLGLTQEAFADRLGVSFTSVNRWENEQTKPSKLAQKQIIKLHKNNVSIKKHLRKSHGK